MYVHSRNDLSTSEQVVSKSIWQEIKGCNSCIYQSTKNLPIDGVYFYPHTKASSSQQGKNGKGQNVFGLLLAAFRGGVKFV